MIIKHCAGLILLLFSFLVVSGQEVNITGTSYEDGKFTIEYDLLDEQTGRQYTLRLYSSLDDYIQPLEQVEGDIGVGVAVGANKKLTWNARKELEGGLDQPLALEIKGQIYIPFITLEGFEDYGTLKRGKEYEIVWAGGRGDNVLNFDMYKGEEKVHTIAGVANTGNYTLEVPTGIPPGKNYRLRVADANNRDEVIYSEPFQVSRRIPLAAKVGGSAVIAGAIAYLLNSLFGTGDSNIPDPMLPER